MAVSTADVSRMAIDRLQRRFDSLQKAMEEVGRVSADLQDQLRELLSYCETESGKYPEDVILNPGDAYRDVADKLRGILDGE